MKHAAIMMIALFSLSLGVPTSWAQRWSPEQLEVWKAIETCDGYMAEENLEKALGCWHEDFSGWLYTEPVPRGKSFYQKFLPYDLKTRDVQVSELRPIDIKVYGNVAIAHYYFTGISKDAQGNESREQGRWTDILLKQDGRWVWIADHGGARPD